MHVDMYLGLHLESNHWILNNTGMCSYFLIKLHNTKLHENLFNGFKVVTCREMDGHTYMSKLVHALSQSFIMNAPKRTHMQMH
jgi:hypothetical protein